MDEKRNDTFKILLELNPVCTILTTFEDGVFVDVNDAFCKNTGYQKEEVIGRSSTDLGIWTNPLEREDVKHQLIESGKIILMPSKIRVKGGNIWNVLASGQLIETVEETYWLSIFMDMERHKSLEAILNDRETQLEILSNKFHDLNLLLHFLGDTWSKKKAAIKSRLKNHLDANVFQFLEKIKHCKNNSEIQTYIRIIDNNLRDLSGVIYDKSQDFTETLTPLEKKILELVRQGKSSKKIAESFNLSAKAIAYHRSNIRKKLNLVNKKINLVMYLRNQET